MASPNFEKTAFKGKREAKAQRDRLDDQVLQLLHQISGHPVDVGLATEGLDMSEAMESQLEFPNGGAELNRERVQILAEFLLAETGLSRAMLAFSKDLRATHQVSDEAKLDQAVKEKAIREFLAENTQYASQSFNLGAMIDNDLTPWTVTVFESFFEVRPNPNLAEIEFLARTTESNSGLVGRWFASKRNRLLNFFKSKKLLGELDGEEAEEFLEALLKEKAAKEGNAI
ncbi:hypothetical protein E2P81_ATG09374 [Venturia nashicola]|uniref:Uncharacterized protein n=1 Tax=Venturia nashicola TaxID=86259 RepID=A0A4Z1NTW6_9PEZI|nr:hypothetical protein E6O75_ATG09581 [Venturia nashicola]TLD25717.1 hypothetical protein E2P81_ATG09374 [Venturia nashicola]